MEFKEGQPLRASDLQQMSDDIGALRLAVEELREALKERYPKIRSIRTEVDSVVSFSEDELPVLRVGTRREHTPTPQECLFVLVGDASHQVSRWEDVGEDGETDQRHLMYTLAGWLNSSEDEFDVATALLDIRM